jgi:hypothetical protein
VPSNRRKETTAGKPLSPHDHLTGVAEHTLGFFGSGCNENRTFLEGDVLEVEYAMAARVLTHVPAGPRPAPPPAQHYFPTEGVTGITGAPSGGPWAKLAKGKIILKTDQCTVLLELGLGRKFQANQAAGTRTEPFSKAMFLKLQYAMAAGC